MKKNIGVLIFIACLFVAWIIETIILAIVYPKISWVMFIQAVFATLLLIGTIQVIIHDITILRRKKEMSIILEEDESKQNCIHEGETSFMTDERRVCPICKKLYYYDSRKINFDKINGDKK